MSCDVREPENVDAMLDEVPAKHEYIDILVNNAGGQFMAPAESITYNGFRAVTGLNLDATCLHHDSGGGRSMINAATGRSSRSP